MTALASPTAIVNYRPVLSSEMSPHINKPATDSNKNLILRPKWWLEAKADWLVASTK
jgi:hypothetical protein